MISEAIFECLNVFCSLSIDKIDDYSSFFEPFNKFLSGFFQRHLSSLIKSKYNNLESLFNILYYINI